MTAPGIRYRPIFGGIFGKAGRYSLATMPAVSNGLHAVRYMVMDARAGAVLSVAETKLDALAGARRLLQAAASVARDAANDHAWQQAPLWPDDGQPAQAGSPVKPVAKRRRDIFEKCLGRCHYCSKPLSLNGKWHVEHMLPRALGGTDDGCNLVAACPPCNLAKRDRTAVEFVSGSAVR